MMKKVLFMLSLVLCFALTGCFNTNTPEPVVPEEEVIVEDTVEASEPDTLFLDEVEECVDEQVNE